MQTDISNIKTLLSERSEGQAQIQNFSEEEVTLCAVSSLFDEDGRSG